MKLSPRQIELLTTAKTETVFYSSWGLEVWSRSHSFIRLNTVNALKEKGLINLKKSGSITYIILTDEGKKHVDQT